MALVRLHSRRCGLVLLLLLALVGILHLISINSLQDVRDRILLRALVEESVYNSRNLSPKGNSPQHIACRHPDLDVKNPEIFRFFRQLDPVKCSEEENWVKVSGSTATITKQAREQHGGDIECQFTELLREDEDTNKRGITTVTHDTFVFVNSDFYWVSCTAKDGKKWENIMAGIRRDDDLLLDVGWDKVPEDSLQMNILILGFDSLSHNTFIRTLPKSYQFLTEVLGANTLNGYNIVGDGTPQALIPILTGKTELELPEARRRMGDKAQYVDTYPFIWNDFRKNGYATLYAEDQPHLGTFTYRLKGFKEPPTQHYMRPFYVSAYPEFSNHPKLCLRDTPRHKVFHDYVKNFMDVYKDKPKFAFAFHTELSHDDYNLVSVADDDFLFHLKSLHEGEHLNNTILVVMSDHGHRFTTIRGTQQGKQEERLPFVAVVLPETFKKKYPSAADNVRENSEHLTTPFDLYPTMQDILHFSGARLGRTTDRGISLFSQIPSSRTCADAYIEAHWCACLAWEPLDPQEERVQGAVQALLHYINSYTAPRRSLCHEIQVHKVNWASKLLPNKGLLSYKRNADVDGFVPDLSDSTAVSEVVYQVHIVTTPGKAHFEASLTYNIRLDTFSLKMDDVSRTNKYGDQAHCIIKTDEQLRKFCYCREPPPPPPEQQ